jgi:hypothetical protein
LKAGRRREGKRRRRESLLGEYWVASSGVEKQEKSVGNVSMVSSSLVSSRTEVSITEAPRL